MSILVSDKILNLIDTELAKSTESILFISAYCKLPLVKHFDSCLKNQKIDKTLLVRFRPEDIISRASDLEMYPYCRDHGWKLYFRLDLHAKTYVFDRLRCIIGSANATSKGLNLGGTGNFEIATACELEDQDVRALSLLLRGAIEIDDTIYSLMSNYLTDKVSPTPDQISWPKEITSLFLPDYSLLFTEDFPLCSHPQMASEDDLLFLNLTGNVPLSEIRKAFKKSKCYSWLLFLIQNQPSQEMYFGSISSCLHTALLNEPKPYRKDVKFLLANLLTWIEELSIDELIIERPNHSQRVRYINRYGV